LDWAKYDAKNELKWLFNKRVEAEKAKAQAKLDAIPKQIEPPVTTEVYGPPRPLWYTF
jgi:hypothetical protein